MASFTFEHQGAVQTFVFDWITEDQASRLLGNSRPKELQKIYESDSYWLPIFQAWCHEKGYGQLYNDWIDDPDGDARSALKKAGPHGDLRDDFYIDLGTVKYCIRQDSIYSGEAGDSILNEFNLGPL